jgi:hypothetical protein
MKSRFMVTSDNAVGALKQRVSLLSRIAETDV